MNRKHASLSRLDRLFKGASTAEASGKTVVPEVIEIVILLGVQTERAKGRVAADRYVEITNLFTMIMKYELMPIFRDGEIEHRRERYFCSVGI